MSSYTDPPILAFDRLSSSPLRVDWLGDVITTFRRGARAQLIKVACSNWTLDTAWGDAQFDVEQFEALVPLAFLRRLRGGDVWHEGYRVGGATLLQKTFAGLQVNEGTWEIVSAGGTSTCSDGISRHELPFSQFVGHKQHTLSHVVKVRVDANTSLLVPCTELARRYFGESGGLISKVFSGAFAARTLYDSETAELNRSSRVANLELGKGLTYHAASAVARIAFDPAARRAFQKVVDSGIVAAADRKSWYVKMGFPINGATDLNVRGLWLQRGPDRSFLAMQILSCSHPFPFEKLFFKLASDQAGGIAGAVKRGGANGEQSPARPAGGSRSGLDAGTANQDLSPLVLDESVEPTDPFPDLASKKVIQVRDEERTATASASPDSPDVDQTHAPAGSTHAQDAPRGVEVAAPRRLYRGGQPEPRSLLWLREEIAYSVPEVTVRSPFGDTVASRHVITYGPPFKRRTSAVWVTVFRYEAQQGIGRSFLCTVVESPASPQSIELLMFDLPSPQNLDLDAFNRLAMLSFIPAENVLREARGTELRIGWTANKLAERDGSQLAVEMVDMMLRAFERR